MLIDLQLHSTYSDGYLTPTEAAKFIAKQGVKVASLTDHNTVGGLEEFSSACAKLGVKTVNGLELYVKLNGKKLNLLWYNFDDADPELHEMLRQSQIKRKGQVRRILKKIVDSNGFEFNVDKILDRYVHYVPINRVIDDIMENKKNCQAILDKLDLKEPNIDLIIRKFFRDKKIGVLRESYINIDRVIHLRNKIGGQLILCHPAKYGYVKREAWIKYKNLGIDGSEILSPHHSIGAVMYLQQLAREFDFIQTGGSDFHRFEGNRDPIQHSWDYHKIDSKYLRRVDEIIARAK
jgi:3',5'-nucleoside bisphosphate phosphatase